MKTIETKEILNIAGRGTVLVIDLLENKLVTDIWVNELPIKIGETIKVSNNGISYKITGIESSRNLMNGKLSSSIGLVVKEIMSL